MPLNQALDSESIDNGLDRINLGLLQKRFMHLNRERWLRMRSALSYRQALFLDTLPLLFHCNHPMLPGYVSHTTPAGISGYRPSKTDISRGKSLARSFCLAGGYLGEDIWGMYLMGSIGSLAHSHHSDFDIWLCHRPGLSDQGLAELEQKCLRISQWARIQRLDMHFFLMDCDAFRAGTPLGMDADSSGTAQRQLLLDEFYRTALHIAGRLPIWWFVPHQDEPDYARYVSTLTERRYLRPNTTLDFGTMHEIPAGEFLGAGIWQLYKAIASPYKSVLKLLLMESYVADFPDIRPLALDFKQQVYAASPDINTLDPYLLSYQRIERYLLRQGDHQRLELARRCLYFKVNKPLSRKPGRRGKSWQRQLLEGLVAEWQWDQDYLHFLDQRSKWKTLQVKAERTQLVQALNQSYRRLTQFARDTGAERAISAGELNVLGRKLQAAFDRRPGKVDWVNPGISKDLSESALTLRQTEANEASTTPQYNWQLLGSETGADTPLRQSDSPAALLLWGHLNGIIEGHLQLTIEQPTTDPTQILLENQIRRTLVHLQQWLPLPRPEPSHQLFERPAAPRRVLFLINLGAEPGSPETPRQGAWPHPSSDPMNYGRSCQNLVASVDLLLENTWGELTCERFQGSSALLNALQTYLSLSLPDSHQAPPELMVECLGHTQGALIRQRIHQWLRDITLCYYTRSKPPGTRYIFTLSGHYWSLQFRGPKLLIREHPDLAQLLDYLGESQRRFSPIVLDSQTLLNHPLKWLARRITARSISVFYHRRNHTLDLYVADERGSVILCECEHTPKLNALNTLHRFLRAVQTRQTGHAISPASRPKFGVQPIAFYELVSDIAHQLHLNKKNIALDLDSLNLMELKGLVDCQPSGQHRTSFFCHEQAFDWQQLGQDVFLTTAQFILQQRRHHERYPVFITDLELNLSHLQDQREELQTSHYLRVKMELERKLSAAIKALR